LRCLLNPTAVPSAARPREASNAYLFFHENAVAVVSSLFSNGRQEYYLSTLGEEERSSLVSKFLGDVGPRFCCYPDEDSSKKVFSNSDVIVHQVLRSNSGIVLTALALNHESYPCDGPPDPLWSTRWYTHQDGQSRQLAEFAIHRSDRPGRVCIRARAAPKAESRGQAGSRLLLVSSLRHHP
jgi:hypothetical protein